VELYRKRLKITIYNIYINVNTTKYYSAVKGKTKLNQVKYICTVFILSSFITAQPADKNQSITFYSGAGIPVLGLNDWYGATPIYGMQYAYQGNDETDIILNFIIKNTTMEQLKIVSLNG
jgi:hypothetical protein